MSNLKHTPGPWKIEEHDDGYLQIETDYKNGLNDVIICNGIYRSGGICDKKNARLIAAAPEMLKALINLVKQLDDLGGDGLTLENEMKFTHYAGIIERATGLPIEEVLK